MLAGTFNIFSIERQGSLKHEINIKFLTNIQFSQKVSLGKPPRQVSLIFHESMEHFKDSVTIQSLLTCSKSTVEAGAKYVQS